MHILWTFYILPLTLFTLLLTTLVHAEFQGGVEAFERADYETAFKEWRPLAEQGEAEAQYNLGALYDKGLGVPQDDAKAVHWYRLAAEQGDVKGQYTLGLMYDRGQGIPQDDTKAVPWYRLAAEQGYALAETNLGVGYAHGQGVPQDFGKAAHWWRLAAEQGEAEAQYNLGILYDKGLGVPQDDAKAVTGIGWPLNKVMRKRSTTWASYTATAEVCPRLCSSPQMGQLSSSTRAKKCRTSKRFAGYTHDTQPAC